MTPKQEAALRLALEFIKQVDYPPYDDKPVIAAIDEALAQQPHCDDCGGFDPECPLAQPAQQEPVAWINWCAATGKRSVSFECESELASQPLYEGITQNAQYHYSKFHSWFDSELHRQKYTKDHPAYLAAQEAWNAANDAAQHRINRLNAEIEAWKVRFKIAEDALAKLNGPEQKPVAWVGSLKDPQPHCVTDLKYCSAAQWDTGYHLKYIPLYTSPQPSKPWAGLTVDEVWKDDDVMALNAEMGLSLDQMMELVEWAEAKLREKNAQPSKPLTDEQIIEMYNEPRSDAEMLEFARAIEAAHGIKGDA